ncbi:hypothetical protein ACHQM5_024291 [Ranunculus cassubicifolius]
MDKIAGADPNDNSTGTTPLVYAVKRGLAEYIKCLLDAGADPNIPDNTGLKPIEIAARNDNIREVLMLFPGTTRIPECPEWSIAGIMKYVHSEAVAEQVSRRRTQNYLRYKSEGESLSRRKEYWLAACYYSDVILHQLLYN